VRRCRRETSVRPCPPAGITTWPWPLNLTAMANKAKSCVPSASIIDCASRPLFVFNGPVHGLDRGLCLHKPLAGLFGLAAVVRAGEYADKYASLLNQLRSRLAQVVEVLIAADLRTNR
jgi:hypothetical protein